MIRPNAKIFTLKSGISGYFGSSKRSKHGPRFGGGYDLWISPGMNGKSGCASRTFEFDRKEFCGIKGDMWSNWVQYECEIFSIISQ